MNKILLICGIFVLIAVLLFPVFFSIFKDSTGRAIYGDVLAYVDEFPAQKDPYAYTAVYAEYEGIAYLFLQYEEQQVIGKRLANGETEYFSNGRVWKTNADGVLMMVDTGPQINTEEIVSVVRRYANGSKSIASCTRANGKALPYWIGKGEYYVQTNRQDSLQEIMALQDGETNCMRWYIIDVYDSSETPSVKLFFHACDTANLTKWISATNLWGELPNALQDIVS